MTNLNQEDLELSFSVHSMPETQHLLESFDPWDGLPPSKLDSHPHSVLVRMIDLYDSVGKVRKEKGTEKNGKKRKG